MTALIVVAVSVFLIAGLVGYKNPTSGKWKYIDTLQDPMTVIGIVLLFLLNSSQRRQLVFIQEQSRLQQQRDALLSKKPDLNAHMSDALLGSSFEYFEESQKLANACDQSGSLDPMCDVAKKLAPSYAEFLKQRDKPAADEAQRVSSFCVASQKLVNDIHSKEEMSSLVADELVKEYKLLLEKGYTAYETEAIQNGANDFKAVARSKIDQTERYFKDDQTEASKMVFADYRTEADEGARLIFALGPCIGAPHKDLDSFLTWFHHTDEANEQIAEIKQQLQHAKDNDSSFSWTKWFNLNLWPYFLISAAALKFSKAMAQLRKGRDEARK